MTVVGSVALRAGSTAAEAAIGTAGTAAGVTQAVAGPFVAVGRTALGALAGGAAGRDTSVKWSAGRRLHLDLDAIAPQWAEYSVAIEDVVGALPGVAAVHVEGLLGRLVVDRVEEEISADEIVTAAREAVAAAVAGGKGLAGEATKTVPVADPGDWLGVVVPATAAVLDVAAVATAVVGRLSRVPAMPRAARAASALISHQPRVVTMLEQRLGRVATDLLLTAAGSATHGLGQAPGAPLLDLVQRAAQIAEALAYRDTWTAREPVLASPSRPQIPVVAVQSSAGSAPPRHRWAAAAAGETSHVMVDAAVDIAVSQAAGGGDAVEDYAEQSANGSLVAAAGALIGGGRVDDVADAVLAGVPKAAHLGRESFAAALGRGLARSGLLVLDPGALRRLDRVRVVVIDGAALRGDARAVLQACATAPGFDEDRIYEIADALLHRETVPDPDPDERPAADAELRWREGKTSSREPAQGMAYAEVIVGGEVVGTVVVGWEIDPYAVALLQTAQRTGTRVALRHVAGTDELAASVAATYPAGTPLLDVVRELQADRGPVMLITALHPDFASTDTLAALAVSDVGVALDDPAAATPWTADLVAGTDLLEAVRVLSALPSARQASSAGVRLAKSGSTLAGLLLVTGESGQRRRMLGRLLSPVNMAAAIALVSGYVTAQSVLSRPDPDPLPLTAWHALDPEIVFARLTGGRAPLAGTAPVSVWRRRFNDLSEHALLIPMRQSTREVTRLMGAARSELNDPLTPVLAVGAAASAILGSSVDALLVTGVMAVNALVGGGQRVRAENAAAELFASQSQLARRVVIPVLGNNSRRLSVARNAERTVTIPATRLRQGDIIHLRAPDVVPADARLLVADDLEVDESSLTGESVPVAKQVDAVGVADPERSNMLFEGSIILSGTARAIVVATGASTAAQRAVSAVVEVGPAGGVAARLRDLTTKVLPLTLAGGGVVTGLSFLRGHPLRQAVADGVAIAIAAVPEGLPLVATVAQLAAARRLASRGVLVRSPRTLEALGRVDTVCFDKTGTLTENCLHVVAAATADQDAAADFPALTATEVVTLLQAAGRACPSPNNGEGHAHATDEAVLAAVVANPGAEAAWDVIVEIPFESTRGYAASVGVPHASGDEDALPRQVLVLKGAPEVVLPRCRFANRDVDRARADAVVEHLAGRGLRVLAVAHRVIDAGAEFDGETETDVIDEAAAELELVGYVGLADTPRASARPLLEQLVAAGRQVALITGDHPVTAIAIARQLGLNHDLRVVTGAELAALDEDARAELAATVQVFARVSPEQKVQVVAALQRAGRVTAMVGDGANDAAAIRMADVGIGVTNRGSSAARGAADLVLTDDDLTVLLDTLVEGRNMWSSVRDALVMLLGGNAGEVAFTVVGTAIGGYAPISTRQLLLVNLLTDMFPALAVAVTPQRPSPEEDAAVTEDELAAAHIAHRHAVLTEPAPSLDRPLVAAIVQRGAITGAAATAAWAIGRWTPGTQRRSATMGLTALVGTQLAQTLLARHRSPLVFATAAGSALVLVGIVQTPGVSHFFGCTPLGPVAWTGVLASTATATAVSAFAPKWLTQYLVADDQTVDDVRTAA
ncbi:MULTISPECIES: cation-translocating P-type ATPase [unclassified Mycolicibacterium]|uniref:cation-translocating P-type ATPase n=1 Tax=unclassified Mycolicibacterium TaxID=2636767 RepID=UPI0028157F2C|nr:MULTISPECIES: cation-translocating P-type ATPase [unclassified Mycolicibacterium]